MDDNKQCAGAFVKLVKCFITASILVILGAIVLGYFVMLLWNYSIAEITSLQEISYLQGVALVLLARILFSNPRQKVSQCKDRKQPPVTDETSSHQ